MSLTSVILQPFAMRVFKHCRILTSQLSFDKDFDTCVESMSSFVNFTANDDDVRKVHQTLSPDVDLALLADAYKDVQLLQQTTKSSGKLTTTARDVLTSLCKQNDNVGQDDSEVSVSSCTCCDIESYYCLQTAVCRLPAFDFSIQSAKVGRQVAA